MSAVKGRATIEKRLRRLRDRYLRAHLRRHFERRPSACFHNHEHHLNPLPYTTGCPETELELAPRRVTTLVVLNDRTDSVRLCMLGSEDPSSWDGTVCETVERAGGCPYFKPRVTMEEAVDEFDGLMKDDKYVLEHFRDIAALQWVLGSRVHRMRGGLLGWLFSALFRRRMRQLPPVGEIPDIPEDLWS